MSPLQKRIDLLALIILSILIVVWFGLKNDRLEIISYPELSQIEGSDLTFDEYANFFETLADNKGANYAFDVLRVADIAPGVDIHLLGHVVGDKLYKQKGLDGISTCTPDFRNACSHSIVVGLFTERGQEALDDIAVVCRDAPGGKGAYTMCFHGLGHGILAYAHYDFGQAVSMCKKTGTDAYKNREYVECVGGATMEMIAGVHDKNTWEAQKGNYFFASDPLAPCDTDVVPSEVRPICYTYLTPHLFEAAGANLADPHVEHFEKAFTYCDSIPKINRAERDACYGGFGKEFVVLAPARDVRDIGSMGEQDLRKVHSWCNLANNYLGTLVCNATALSALFWGGENKPEASFLFCATESNKELQNECYAQLAKEITFYHENFYQGKMLCEKLPEPHKQFCIANLE